MTILNNRKLVLFQVFSGIQIIMRQHDFRGGIIALFLIMLFLPNAFSQRYQVDSMNNIIKKHAKNDRAKVDLLTGVAYFYCHVRPDSTVILSNNAYRLAIQLDYKKGEADALKIAAIGQYLTSAVNEAVESNNKALKMYQELKELKGQGAVLNNLAMIYQDRGDLKGALLLYNQSTVIRRQLNDMKGVAASYNNIGNLYLDLNNYPAALENLLKGLELRKKLKNKSDIANSYINIAGFYLVFYNYDEARVNALKSLELYKSDGNSDGICQADVVLGIISLNKNEFKEAINYFEDGKRLSLEMQNDNNLSLCYMNLGQCYIKTGNLTKANEYFEKGMVIVNTYQDIVGIATGKKGIAEIRLKQGKTSEATALYEEAFKFAITTGRKEMIAEISEALADIYEKNGHQNQALFYYKKALVYKDSLNADKASKRIQEVRFNHILEKKQSEIALLLKDKKIKQFSLDRQNIISKSLLVGLLLLAIIIVLLIFNIRKVRHFNKKIENQKSILEKQATELNQLNLEKDKLFSVLSHDLKGPVASLMGIVDLMEEDELPDEDFILLKDNFKHQLRAVNLLLDNLLNWSRLQIDKGFNPRKSNVSVAESVEESERIYREIMQKKNLTLEKKIDASHRINVDSDHLEIVIRNLLSNAIKFSEPGKAIQIDSEVSGTYINLYIRDFGTGMSPEQVNKLFEFSADKTRPGTKGEKGNGIGLILCKDFVELNGGHLSVTSKLNEGTEFKVTLPTAK